MLLRKTAWFWKSGLAVISFVLMFSISGCSDTPPEEDTVSETVIDVQDVSEEEQENEEEIINICIDLYDKAAEENKLDDLEIIRSIVNRLGENGYPAVDSRNQVNMTEAEQVLELYRRRLPDVFRCLVFSRIICSYIEWSRGTYRITGTAIG